MVDSNRWPITQIPTPRGALRSGLRKHYRRDQVATSATKGRNPRKKAEKQAPEKIKVELRRMEALRLGLQGSGSGCCALGIFVGVGYLRELEDLWALRALISNPPPSPEVAGDYRRIYFYNYNQLMMTVTDNQL